MMATTSLLAETRTLSGVILQVYTIETKSDLAVELADEGTKYAQQCEQLGRGHNLGPPHVYLWGG